jgi:hypothetical protein
MSIAVNVVQFQRKISILRNLGPTALFTMPRFQTRVEESFFELKALKRTARDQDAGERNSWACFALEPSVPSAPFKMISPQPVIFYVFLYLFVVAARFPQIEFDQNLPIARGIFNSLYQIINPPSPLSHVPIIRFGGRKNNYAE